MMRKYIKRRSLIITLFLVLFLLVNIVISYSYFIGKVYNNESEATLSLTSNGLKIVYQNDTPIINEEDITSGWVSTKSFSISANAQNNDISLVEPKIWYNMKLIIDENTFSDGTILYSLTNTTTDSKGLAADSFSELSIPTGSNMEVLSLGSGYVELGNNMHTYVLEVKYNPSKDAEYNKKFSCHIVTEIVSNVTLNIDLDGGESSDTLERSLGKKTIVKLSTPTKSGCDFDGWELVSGDGLINNDSTVTVGTSDMKVKAKWIVRTINVHLDLNGGTTTDNVDILAPQDSYIDLALPTRDGYDFDSWELLDGTAEIKGSRIMTAKTNIILKAKWSSASNLIALGVDLDGGTSSTLSSVQTVASNSSIVLDNPIKDGYVFLKWQVITGDASVSGNTIVFGEQNTVIKAVWIVVVPVFTYLTDTGSPASYTIIEEANNNWRIKFLESGNLIFSDLGSAQNGIDVFLVGGGGRGGTSNLSGGGGGAGGYTTTEKNIEVTTDATGYKISIGGSGTKTTAFGFTANPGGAGSGGTSEYHTNVSGSSSGTGRGGSGGGTGKYNYAGGNGGDGAYEFYEESSGVRYGGGGGGGGGYVGSDGGFIGQNGGTGGAGGGGNGGRGLHSAGNVNPTAGATNTGGGGGGGGGGRSNYAAGGSGIVVIRNARG